MYFAESVVALLLLILIARPLILKRLSTPGGKLILIGLVIYLANTNILLGCLAAIMFIQIFRNESTNTWRPPRVDRLGIDILLSPQESFFTPSIRIHGNPISEQMHPFTPF